MSIDPKKYDCEVKMTCPDCNNTNLETREDTCKSIKPIKCTSCGKEFTKDELIKANEKTVKNKQKEIANKFSKDAKEEILNMLKKFKK